MLAFCVLIHRNLDFADLDFLEIEGNFRWSQEQQIFYSSCRHFKFSKSDVNFIKFFGCHFEKLQSQSTKFYDVEFYSCDIFGASFEDSALINMAIDECSVSKLSFNRVEVDNLVFLPPRKEWHEGLAASYKRAADNYKRFRVLYQNNGHRREAGEAYYLERLYELKFNIKNLEVWKALKMVLKNGTDYAGAHLRNNIKNTFRILGNGGSFLIWGFGERPGRTIIFSVFTLLFYTLSYYFSTINYLHQDFTNSIYLSTIMFSTLGFGDYEPVKDGAFKLVLASEALIGAFTWGLFIAGYANKAKY